MLLVAPRAWFGAGTAARRHIHPQLGGAIDTGTGNAPTPSNIKHRFCTFLGKHDLGQNSIGLAVADGVLAVPVKFGGRWGVTVPVVSEGTQAVGQLYVPTPQTLNTGLVLMRECWAALRTWRAAVGAGPEVRGWLGGPPRSCILVPPACHNVLLLLDCLVLPPCALYSTR